MAKRSFDAALTTIRERGLRYPGAHTKSPWPGHLDLAVNDKTFAYLSAPGEPFSVGCKLPASAQIALELPFVSPTPYGLGKSGWVTAKLPEGEEVPVELFLAWIDESYRAQAPKKLVRQLDGGEAPSTSTASAAAKKAPTRKAPTRKAPTRKAPTKKAPTKKAPTKKAATKKRATR